MIDQNNFVVFIAYQMSGSTVEQEMILREKISNKIHLTIHFQENGF